MAYKLVSTEYCPCMNDYKREYITDTDADLENLPKAAPRSFALSPSGKMKIVNASGEWVDFGEG